jgi:DNA-binding SARP family transcriptional activator
MSEELQLALLGNVEVRRDGVSVTGFRSYKAQALLYYLAVTGCPHTRPALAGLLWGEMPEAKALTNLRQTLTNLRHLVGSHLTISRGEIAFNRDRPYWLDVEDFEALAAGASAEMGVAAWREAVELYRGDFLEDFYVRNALEFEEWALAQQARLRELAVQALQGLALNYTRQGDAGRATAITYTSRLLALEPWREEAHQGLMLLLAQGGQRGAALAQFETCRQVLAQELGVEPGPETRTLYQRIRDGELNGFYPSLVPTQIPSPSTPRLPAFLDSGAEPKEIEGSIFVGRKRELARLDGFLEKALRGRGVVSFVTGEAGQGKTSLLKAFSRQAQAARSELIVASGACNVYTGQGDPFLPFRDILGMLTGDVEALWASGTISRAHALRLWSLLPHAAQALVEHGPNLIDTFVVGGALERRAVACAPDGADWLDRLQELRANREAGSGGGSPDQSRLFAEYSVVLGALAQGQPLLLILDDLHWADLSSISLLSYLARRLAEAPILIVAAYRPEEVAHPSISSGQGGQHPLADVLSEFKRYLGDVWVDLDQVGPAQGREFVDAFLDTQPNRLSEEFRQRLTRTTGGHPLFTIELLRDLEERGDLRQDEAGLWVAELNLVGDVLPVRVEGVIEKRIGRLDPELREALVIASVEGEEFTAEVIAKVQDSDPRDVAWRFGGGLN